MHHNGEDESPDDFGFNGAASGLDAEESEEDCAPQKLGFTKASLHNPEDYEKLDRAVRSLYIL